MSSLNSAVKTKRLPLHRVMSIIDRALISFTEPNSILYIYETYVTQRIGFRIVLDYKSGHKQFFNLLLNSKEVRQLNFQY